MKKGRQYYLEKSTDILCKCVYRLCKDAFLAVSGGSVPDAKALKEVCAVVKETAAVVSGLDKKNVPENDGIKIIFQDTEDYCE